MANDYALANALVGNYWPGRYWSENYWVEVGTVTVVASTSTAAWYQIRLKNQSGAVVAIFTDWLSLTFEKIVDDVWKYTLIFGDDDDNRFDLFELDGQIEIYRAIPGASLDWYLEFEGLHRTSRRETSKTGDKIFVSQGVGYNDFLARTTIMYKAGTIRADKNDAAETVMKEYVSENCTPTGDIVSVGRLNYDVDLGTFLYNSALPGFSVQADSGQGSVWAGSRPYEPLLTVLQDIATEAGIDFNVVGTGAATFEFQTYLDQLGEDRTTVGLDSLTGKNAAGNSPVVFSVPLGVVQSLKYTLDRLAEANAVVVLGKGEGSTRTTLTRADANAIDDSPWNRREISRPVTDYDEDYETYSLQVSGDEILSMSGAKETFVFVPLQQVSQLYGLHYFLGDRVTAKYGTIEKHKRLMRVKVTVKGRSNQEQITITFADF